MALQESCTGCSARSASLGSGLSASLKEWGILRIPFSLPSRRQRLVHSRGQSPPPSGGQRFAHSRRCARGFSAAPPRAHQAGSPGPARCAPQEPYGAYGEHRRVSVERLASDTRRSCLSSRGVDPRGRLVPAPPNGLPKTQDLKGAHPQWRTRWCTRQATSSPDQRSARLRAHRSLLCGFSTRAFRGRTGGREDHGHEDRVEDGGRGKAPAKPRSFRPATEEDASVGD